MRAKPISGFDTLSKLSRLQLVVLGEARFPTFRTKSLADPTLASRLFWKCHQYLKVLENRNRLLSAGTLGYIRKKIIDEWPNTLSAPYIISRASSSGTKPMVRNQIRYRLSKKYEKYWESIPRNTHEKP